MPKKKASKKRAHHGPHHHPPHHHDHHGPRHHHPPPHPPHLGPGEWVPPVEVERRIESIEALLVDWNRDRVLSRYAFEDGPDHMRVANSVLAGVLHLLLEEVARMRGLEPLDYRGPSVPVELDEPPHSPTQGTPIEIPTRLLSTLCKGDDGDIQDALNALLEGPTHEVATNVIFMHLMEVLADLVSPEEVSES